jgi:hypothetical protein
MREEECHLFCQVRKGKKKEEEKGWSLLVGLFTPP